MNDRSTNGRGKAGTRTCDTLPGIVILNRTFGQPVVPRIEAFVYGGEVQSEPRTLPYGRWKGVA